MRRDGTQAREYLSTRVEVDPVTGCWTWQLYRTPTGYGQRGRANGVRGSVYVHRWAYAELVGPIPEGAEIDHLCRNRGCCNPAHLEAVSHRENNSRSESITARQARQTHCKRGHELDGVNLAIRKGTSMRKCRQCDALRARRYRANRVPS